MKATASCTSKGIVTLAVAVPLSYSFGTRSTKRSSWLARLICSSGVSGAAVKPSRSASTRSRAASKPPRRRRAGRGEPREVAVGGAALGGAALLAVLGRDRPPVAEHDRRGFGEAAVEAAFGRLRGFVEVGEQARLEGVEQVLFDLQDGFVRGDLAGRQFLQRGRAVDPGTGEAGRLAEVADLHPGPRLGGVAGPRGGDRDRHRAAAQGGDDRSRAPRPGRLRRARRGRAGRRPARLRSRAARPARGGEAAGAAARARCASARSTAPSSRSPKSSCVCASKSSARICVRRLPGRLGGGRGRRRQRAERTIAARTGGDGPATGGGGQRPSSGPPPQPSCSSISSCFAACVTWPAIASAWDWAWAPSASACLALNFSPSASRSRRSEAKSTRLSSSFFGLLRLLRVLAGDHRFDPVVGDEDAAEDVGDVGEARGGDEAEFARLLPRR